MLQLDLQTRQHPWYHRRKIPMHREKGAEAREHCAVCYSTKPVHAVSHVRTDASVAVSPPVGGDHSLGSAMVTPRSASLMRPPAGLFIVRQRLMRTAGAKRKMQDESCMYFEPCHEPDVHLDEDVCGRLAGWR